jgi:hypothetical protein
MIAVGRLCAPYGGSSSYTRQVARNSLALVCGMDGATKSILILTMAGSRMASMVIR